MLVWMEACLQRSLTGVRAHSSPRRVRNWQTHILFAGMLVGASWAEPSHLIARAQDTDFCSRFRPARLTEDRWWFVSRQQPGCAPGSTLGTDAGHLQLQLCGRAVVIFVGKTRTHANHLLQRPLHAALAALGRGDVAFPCDLEAAQVAAALEPCFPKKLVQLAQGSVRRQRHMHPVSVGVTSFHQKVEARAR